MSGLGFAEGSSRRTGYDGQQRLLRNGMVAAVAVATAVIGAATVDSRSCCHCSSV